MRSTIYSFFCAVGKHILLLISFVAKVGKSIIVVGMTMLSMCVCWHLRLFVDGNDYESTKGSKNPPAVVKGALLLSFTTVDVVGFVVVFIFFLLPLLDVYFSAQELFKQTHLDITCACV